MDFFETGANTHSNHISKAFFNLLPNQQVPKKLSKKISHKELNDRLHEAYLAGFITFANLACETFGKGDFDYDDFVGEIHKLGQAALGQHQKRHTLRHGYFKLDIYDIASKNSLFAEPLLEKNMLWLS